jgi:hypothetical protein
MHLTLAMTASFAIHLSSSSILADMGSNNDRVMVTKGRNLAQVIFAGREASRYDGSKKAFSHGMLTPYLTTEAQRR